MATIFFKLGIEVGFMDFLIGYFCFKGIIEYDVTWGQDKLNF